mgnify:CR=1 FL=1
MKKFEITTDITALLPGLFITAFEGGISHWCKSVRILRTEVHSSRNRIWYNNLRFWSQEDFAIEFSDAESDDTWIFTQDNFKNLVHLSKVPKRHIDSIIDVSYDSEAADVFVQVLLFGEIIFG